MLKRLLLVLFCLLMPLSTAAAQATPPVSPHRDYWPTTGWRTAAPADEGMNAEMLAALPALVEKDMPYVHSILVVRHGYIVFEKYFAGSTDSSLNELMSVTKSFTSSLAGIALKNGDIKDVDVTFASLFPEYFTGDKNADKRGLTLQNLLMMRSGLTWDDGTSAQSLWNSREDQMAAMINRPLAHTPGTTWNYSTGDSQLVSGMFTRSTGLTLQDYADKHLFTPLGITNRNWLKDAKGYNIGGARLALTARDMAKLGYLYLNMGQWDGSQVVPADWVKLTTTAQTDKPDYGYMWWIYDPKTPAQHKAYAAQGYAGQIIMVVPDFDLIAVTTAAAWVYGAQAGKQGDALNNLINNQIIPAVADVMP